MAELMLKHEIDAVIRKVCQANGCPELATQISAKWSRRIVKTTGLYHLDTMTIHLSQKLLLNLPEDQRAEAIAREACHLIAWHKHQDTSHHNLWQALMRNAGFPHAKRVMELREAS
jgi:predicted SprT family Zn-dependent metalloprotease